jgi:hypothetical protein
MCTCEFDAQCRRLSGRSNDNVTEVMGVAGAIAQRDSIDGLYHSRIDGNVSPYPN